MNELNAKWKRPIFFQSSDNYEDRKIDYEAMVFSLKRENVTKLTGKKESSKECYLRSLVAT